VTREARAGRGGGEEEKKETRGQDADEDKMEKDVERGGEKREGVPKRMLQAGSAVSTLVASAKAQGVDRPAPTASSHQKRRAAERQSRVCGPSAAEPFPCGCYRLSCRQLNSNLLFARVG